MLSDECNWVAGVDESGRGPLAGPVFAACVILDPARQMDGLADSKTLSEDQRNKLTLAIKRARNIALLPFTSND